jgi:hypothetical protein
MGTVTLAGPEKLVPAMVTVSDPVVVTDVVGPVVQRTA